MPMNSGVSRIAQIERAAAGMTRELALDRRAIADEQQPYLQMTGSDQRAVDDAARPVVAAHRVNGDTHLFQVLRT